MQYSKFGDWTDMQTENTPYAEALQLIQEHPTTGSAVGLAKLILSLWNDDCGYFYRFTDKTGQAPGRAGVYLHELRING
jgi:hypothetical protein